jgi:type IV pilus assembly protein PilO
MNLSEVNWDINAVGSWPTPVKVMVLSVVGIVSFIIGLYFDTYTQLDALNWLEKKELELKLSFENKQKQTVNLEDYQKQLLEIEAQLQEMIRLMPVQEELANLLSDISRAGVSSGLKFRLFKPAPTVAKDFYSELPINIEVVGRYEELGLFVSGLSMLPRIVTLHDVSLVVEGQERKQNTADGLMVMTATVKTYNERNEAVLLPNNKTLKTKGWIK